MSAIGKISLSIFAALTFTASVVSAGPLDNLQTPSDTVKSIVSSTIANFASLAKNCQVHIEGGCGKLAWIPKSSTKFESAVSSVSTDFVLVTRIVIPGPLDELKRLPHDTIEGALAGVLSYNAVCKDITPAASENTMLAYVMFAKSAGVDFEDPGTRQRIKERGSVIVLWFALGPTSRNEYCSKIYGDIQHVERAFRDVG